MKIFLNENRDSRMESEFRPLGNHMHHPPMEPMGQKTFRGPGRPMPPHERRALISIDFDDEDWVLLKDAFGDEDTAAAAAEIIREAPPEILKVMLKSGIRHRCHIV